MLLQDVLFLHIFLGDSGRGSSNTELYVLKKCITRTHNMTHCMIYSSTIVVKLKMRAQNGLSANEASEEQEISS
jgi:hypothetical protein